MFASLISECRYEILEGGVGDADLYTRSVEMLGRRVRHKPVELPEVLSKQVGSKDKGEKKQPKGKAGEPDHERRERRAQERTRFNANRADIKSAKADKKHRIRQQYTSQKRQKTMTKALGAIASSAKKAVSKP